MRLQHPPPPMVNFQFFFPTFLFTDSNLWGATIIVYSDIRLLYATVVFILRIELCQVVASSLISEILKCCRNWKQLLYMYCLKKNGGFGAYGKSWTNNSWVVTVSENKKIYILWFASIRGLRNTWNGIMVYVTETSKYDWNLHE